MASRDIHLSKLLSWLLRHGAVKEGLPIRTDGYMNIEDLLNHKTIRDKFSLEDIKRVVEVDNKHRFSLRYEKDIQICANQGHTINVVTNLELSPILGTEDIQLIHGTYFKNWDNIKNEGISRMKRNHIHFSKGLPGDRNIVSGIRSDAEIFIYINLKLAISDNILFYLSVNGVILSPGNDKGIIEPKYFLKVCNRFGQIL
nr:tRNA 2'-phosphotransferase 1 [Leptinotarsa decemlineata]